MEITDCMTEEDFNSRHYIFLQTEKMVPYTATFDHEEGRKVLLSTLAKAPANAVKWRFQTYFGEIASFFAGEEEYAPVEFYQKRY